MAQFTTIAAPSEDEFIEKRSRFLCAAAPVTTEEKAARFVQARRALHRDARHTPYAWLLRDGNQRCSDDGEPQGTGGQPMLEVLRRAQLVDVCVAVTRYFGGILLGSGGLTRAYSHGAVLAVKSAERVLMSECAVCLVTVGYPQYGMLGRMLPDFGARVLDSQFDETVSLRIRLKIEDAGVFAAALTEATGAAAHFEQLFCEYAVL